MGKNNIIAFLTISLIVISSCGNGKQEKVYLEKVQVRNITETVSASGKIQPETEVKISADVSGEITAMLVKEGDSVTKGQLLLRINPDIYQSGLAQLQASLDNAKAGLASSQSQLLRVRASLKQSLENYNRQKKLFEQKVISQQEFLSAETTLEMSKADAESAEKNTLASHFNVKALEAKVKEGNTNLSRTSIYAPATGIISQLNSELGERVVGTAQMTGTEILRIADLSKMEVRVDVNENDIVRVKLGDSVDISVDAFGDRVFKGIVSEMANSANFSQTASLTDQVTNFVIKIRILTSSYSDLLKSNGKSPFRPGMSATVEIMTQTVMNVLSISTGSVTVRKPFKTDSKNSISTSEKDAKDLTTWVFIIEKNVVKPIKVKTGIQDNKYIQVLEGLKDGQEIVGGPYMSVSKTLLDGLKVKVVDKEKVFEK